VLYYSRGSVQDILSFADLRSGLHKTLGLLGEKKKVLIVPPDITRVHSQAGPLTRFAVQYYGSQVTDILPAIGTHDPMTDGEIATMYGDLPRSLFRKHDFRHALATLGEVPAEVVRMLSGGAVDYPVPIQVGSLVNEGGHDLILSIGQVVPHEVVGMANHSKNIFVGTGGVDGINRTHFLGAAYGMERIMGRTDTPVRKVLDYGADHFAHHLPIVYVLTVVDRDRSTGGLVVRGLYIGDDVECFTKAAALSLEVNFTLLERPLRKVVVYLEPSEFKSTWLGNKSIYRTRMAIADGGELIVLAPAVSKFGEDAGIDRLIRKYGYVGTQQVLDLVSKHEDLRNGLSAAAHLMHGSSDGRFSITYCPGGLSRQEIESVNFRYAPLPDMLRRYDPASMRDGMQVLPGGEEVFYISNPALGLWAHRDRMV
jgi:nickel-dependent lactate racemase